MGLLPRSVGGSIDRWIRVDLNLGLTLRPGTLGECPACFGEIGFLAVDSALVFFSLHPNASPTPKSWEKPTKFLTDIRCLDD